MRRLVPSQFPRHAPRRLHRRQGSVHPHGAATGCGGGQCPPPPAATQIQNPRSRRGIPWPAGNGVARQASGQAGVHAAVGHGNGLRYVAIHGLTAATAAAGDGALGAWRMVRRWGACAASTREGPVEASLASRTYRAACRARWKQVRQRVGPRAAVGEAHGAQAEAGCTHPKRRRAAWPLVSWRSAHAARGPRHLLGEQSGRGKAAKFPRAAGALAVGAARPRQMKRRDPQSRGPQRAAVRVGVERHVGWAGAGWGPRSSRCVSGTRGEPGVPNAQRRALGVGSRAGARAKQWRRKRRRGAGYWRVIRPKITRGPSGVSLRADGCAVTKISKSRYGVRMLICPSWLPFTISWPLFCAGWPAA